MRSKLRKAHRWNMADTVTSMRMAGSLFLLFLPLKSIWFFGVYTLTGFTDILDGWLARKTGRASEFGARLDSMHSGICCVLRGTGNPPFADRLPCG